MLDSSRHSRGQTRRGHHRRVCGSASPGNVASIVALGSAPGREPHKGTQGMEGPRATRQAHHLAAAGRPCFFRRGVLPRPWSRRCDAGSLSARRSSESSCAACTANPREGRGPTPCRCCVHIVAGIAMPIPPNRNPADRARNTHGCPLRRPGVAWRSHHRIRGVVLIPGFVVPGCG